MESHTAKLDQDYLNQTPTKLSKKEKKKLKEAKKLKNKKLDADKVRIMRSFCFASVIIKDDFSFHPLTSPVIQSGFGHKRSKPRNKRKEEEEEKVFVWRWI